MKSEKVLTWKRHEALCKKLVGMVRKSGYAPDYVVGVARGGLVPLTIIAEAFGTRDVATIAARSYSGKKRGKLVVTSMPSAPLRGKRVLLVDDITDSGETLKHIADLVKKRYRPRELRTATVVVNTRNCRHAPDYVAEMTDRWTVFPWSH